MQDTHKIPEDLSVHVHLCENLRSCIYLCGFFFVLCYFYFIDSGTVRSEEDKYTGEEKDLGDMMEEFLAHKQQSTSTPLRQQHTQPDGSSTNQEMFQDVTEQLERLETTSPSVVTHTQGTCTYHGY